MVEVELVLEEAQFITIAYAAHLKNTTVTEFIKRAALQTAHNLRRTLEEEKDNV